MSNTPMQPQLLTPEWAERFLASLERIADALDRAIPPTPELTAEEAAALVEEQAQLDRLSDESREEWIAAIERCALRGEEVPEGAYRKAGLQPPPRVRTVEPAPEELSAPQPGAALAEPLTEPPRPPEPEQPPTPSAPAAAPPQIISTRKEHL